MINKMLATLCTLLLALPAMAGDESGVKIELSGLEKASGAVFIAVYDTEKNWLGDDVVSGHKVSIEESRQDGIVYAFLPLPPGDYALSIFYDENGNGKLDTNFIGIPKEPIAVSNNAPGKFGPPKYKDALFNVGADAALQQISISAH